VGPGGGSHGHADPCPGGEWRWTFNVPADFAVATHEESPLYTLRAKSVGRDEACGVINALAKSFGYWGYDGIVTPDGNIV